MQNKVSGRQCHLGLRKIAKVYTRVNILCHVPPLPYCFCTSQHSMQVIKSHLQPDTMATWCLQAGLIPRIFTYLFDRIMAASSRQVSDAVSCRSTAIRQSWQSSAQSLSLLHALLTSDAVLAIICTDVVILYAKCVLTPHLGVAKPGCCVTCSMSTLCATNRKLEIPPAPDLECESLLFCWLLQKEGCERHFLCKCSFLEIYKEVITDLLNPAATWLQIREDSKTGTYVEGLSEHVVASGMFSPSVDKATSHQASQSHRPL